METLWENTLLYFPLNFIVPNDGLGRHINFWFGADFSCECKLKKSCSHVKISSRAAINIDKKVYFYTRINKKKV